VAREYDCDVWMWHVIHECVTWVWLWCVNVTCDTWMWHVSMIVTCECDMWHVIHECGTWVWLWRVNVTCDMWYMNVTREYDCDVWMWHVIHECGMWCSMNCTSVLSISLTTFHQWVYVVICIIQCESKKSPSEVLWQFFQNGREFFDQISHAYYAFLSTLGYEFLFSYLQLWWSYAILSMTTQFTLCVQNVHHRLKHKLAFSDIFPKQLEIFSQNFTHVLNVHMHARMQIFIQLSPTVTKLCHIKCDHSGCVLVDGGHFEHIMVVVLNMA